MINAQMTEYKYFVYKENEYGEQVIELLAFPYHIRLQIYQ